MLTLHTSYLGEQRYLEYARQACDEVIILIPQIFQYSYSVTNSARLQMLPVK